MKVTSAILCASTKKFDNTKTMATYSCPHCKNNTVVQASIEDPYCVHCGHDSLRSTVQASKAGKQLMTTREEELASIKCPSCSSYLMMNNATLANHATDNTGTLHCPVCASSITFACNDEEPEQTQDDIDPSVDTSDIKKATSEPEQNPDKTVAKRLVLANLVKGTPTFVAAKNKVLCFVDNLVIASAELETEEQAEDQAQGLNAVTSSDEFDLEKVLDENDFDLATVDADVEEQLVKENEEQSDKAIAEETANLKTKFKEVVGIAMAGVNRGFFDSTNYLQSGLTNALLTRGYTQEEAEAIAEEIIEDVSDDYAEEVQRIAFDLLAKPEEVRNELATTIAAVKPKATANTKKVLPNSFVAASATNKATDATSTVAKLVAGKKLF